MLNTALIGADRAVHVLHNPDHARPLLPAPSPRSSALSPRSSASRSHAALTIDSTPWPVRWLMVK
uniref:Uncharacterized protein n=1 Tax=Arundo donax TaxID=35708 RepID=A0A0A9DCY5_ARUDO